MHHLLLALQLHKNYTIHQSLETHGLQPTRRNMLIRSQWGTLMSWNGMTGNVDYVISTSKASLIKRVIGGEILLLRACLKAMQTLQTFAMWFSVNVMHEVYMFKAYCCCEQIDRFLFHKVGWEQPSGKEGNFLLQIHLSVCVPKIIKIHNAFFCLSWRVYTNVNITITMTINHV